MKNKILGLLSFSLIAFHGFAQEQLSLSESRTLALEYNQKIKIADEMIAEKESDVRYVFTQFLPNLKASGSYNYYHDIDDINLPGSFLPTANSLSEAQQGIYSGTSDVYFPGFNLELGDIDYFSSNLTLTQPIYMGGKIRSSYQMTKMGREISIYNRKLQSSDVLLETDQAYWNLVSINEKGKLAEKYVKMLSALVQDLQNAFDLEITTKNELLKAQVQLNQAKLDLFRVQNLMVLSKMSLCQVIGRDLMGDIIATDTTITITQNAIDADYMQKALNQRPELLMLGKQVEISQEQIKNTQADYLPQLGVGASYSYISRIESLIGSSKILAVQANLSVPVFHWQERKHKVASVRFRSKQKELEMDRTRDLISLEVQQSYFKLQEAYQQIELAKVSMDQANENVELTQNSFYEGLANTTELLDAQAFWQRAHGELIDSKINYKLKEIRFLKSIGELAI
ncbi:TolC family protein [Labilibaculum sp. K2S]|uniref:TolC family protein n=1 Tax=Labilibaculum sp. K2S TaxID=3056386 RepID=UPI0025A4B90D|nr:TolC family protein [Labilibaculum sp. K2S]MDM8160504.1 TolC family protein [Labilibaculum sp. K2S]